MSKAIALKKITKYSTSASARARDGMTILDGLHLLQEAMRQGSHEDLLRIYCTDSAQYNTEISPFLDTIDEEKLTIIPDGTMRKIAPTKTPPGILGVYRIPTSPQSLAPDAQSILLLDCIADPGNLGTIIRTAVAMNVDAIFCSPGCADVWSPKVLRAAQGAHFYTTIFSQFNLTTIKEVFDGKIFGTFLDEAATSLYATDLTGKVGMCVGNEGAGIHPQEFVTYGDAKIYIPMAAHFESLNVGIATGMCLSEKRRQDLSSQSL